MEHMRRPKQTFHYAPKIRDIGGPKVRKLVPDHVDILCPEFSITVSVVTKGLNLFLNRLHTLFVSRSDIICTERHYFISAILSFLHERTDKKTIILDKSDVCVCS
jgi:hypothetical protein